MNSTTTILPATVEVEAGMECVVGEFNDLHASEVSAERGNHLSEDIVGHGSGWPDTLQRHDDGLRFERADPDRQHALAFALFEQQQRG